MKKTLREKLNSYFLISAHPPNCCVKWTWLLVPQNLFIEGDFRCFFNFGWTILRPWVEAFTQQYCFQACAIFNCIVPDKFVIFKVDESCLPDAEPFNKVSTGADTSANTSSRDCRNFVDPSDTIGEALQIPSMFNMDRTCTRQGSNGPKQQ